MVVVMQGMDVGANAPHASSHMNGQSQRQGAAVGGPPVYVTLADLPPGFFSIRSILVSARGAPEHIPPPPPPLPAVLPSRRPEPIVQHNVVLDEQPSPRHATLLPSKESAAPAANRAASTTQSAARPLPPPTKRTRRRRRESLSASFAPPLLSCSAAAVVTNAATVGKRSTHIDDAFYSMISSQAKSNQHKCERQSNMATWAERFFEANPLPAGSGWRLRTRNVGSCTKGLHCKGACGNDPWMVLVCPGTGHRSEWTLLKFFRILHETLDVALSVETLFTPLIPWYTSACVGSGVFKNGGGHCPKSIKSVFCASKQCIKQRQKD
jgi:hypothetical protein